MIFDENEELFSDSAKFIREEQHLTEKMNNSFHIILTFHVHSCAATFLNYLFSPHMHK